jgi:hypothetical protein
MGLRNLILVVITFTIPTAAFPIDADELLRRCSQVVDAKDGKDPKGD